MLKSGGAWWYKVNILGKFEGIFQTPRFLGPNSPGERGVTTTANVSNLTGYRADAALLLASRLEIQILKRLKSGFNALS